MSSSVPRLLTGAFVAGVLAIAPVSAFAQGNSPGNRKCPQGQVPQGNSGYCIPNPGQNKAASESKKVNKKSLGSGVYRNTADDNPRNGRKFKVIKKNGRTYHRYPGTGCRNVVKKNKSGKKKTTKVCKVPAVTVLATDSD